jgi:membrane protein YqaA with SNARE-associated domain
MTTGETGVLLAVALLAVFAINVVPAFMPPTWSVLAFFLIRYELPLLPLAVGGAVAASSGRLTLALLSRHFGRRVLSVERQASLDALGAWLGDRARWAAPVAVLIYSFGPIPSNQLFIAAGLTRVRLGEIVGAFFVGRLLSYTMWTASAGAVASGLSEIFSRHLHSGAVAVQLLSLLPLFLIARIDWRRVLHLNRFGGPQGASQCTEQ